MEVIVFAAFVVLQGVAKAAPKVLGRLREWWLVQKLAKNHWLVWVGHPSVLHGLHDYMVHLVVYSGYVLKVH